MDTEAEAGLYSGFHDRWKRVNTVYDRFVEHICTHLRKFNRSSLIRIALFAALGLSVIVFFIWNFDHRDILQVINVVPQSSKHDYTKEAYVTLLSPQKPHPWTVGEIDYYFEACKVQAHRLLRNVTTRDPHNRPYIILATPDVYSKQIEILEAHGAIVRRVPIIEPPEGTVNLDLTNPRYRDQFTKLHVWNMTEYDRIAYFDADTLAIRPMHSIFDTRTKMRKGEEWLFAAVYDSGDSRSDGQRNKPGLQDTGRRKDNQLNAGVFLLSPTETQRDYVWNMMRHPPQRDFSVFMEQDFLRWAYRDGGPYPWIRLSHLYNTQWCREWDLDTAYVLHDKLWGRHGSELRGVWYQAWGEMVGWDVARYSDGIAQWQGELGPDNKGILEDTSG